MGVLDRLRKRDLIISVDVKSVVLRVGRRNWCPRFRYEY